MGYGWNTRSAEDVQRDNGKAYDFEKIEFQYKNTKPLRGKKRGHLDIRPHGERDRSWERIVKVSDNEYFLTNTAWGYYETHHDPERNYELNRAITFRLDGDTETVIVHTPRCHWGDDYKKPFAERALMAKSGFYGAGIVSFYSYNLPEGVYLSKYGTKAYLCLKEEEDGNHKSYTVMQGDVTITRKKGSKFFKALSVHREFTYSLDRAKTKEIRSKLEPFINYTKIMLPLIEKPPKYRAYGYCLPFGLNDLSDYNLNNLNNGELLNIANKSWEELIAMDGDELPEYWFFMVECYKQKLTHQGYNWQTKTEFVIHPTPERIRKAIIADVYKQAKPLKIEDVELGKPFRNNKYHNWY